MENKYGIDDVQLMAQNSAKSSTLALQNQNRQLQEREAEYLQSKVAQYSDKNIELIKNSKYVSDLATFGSIVKINAFKSILESFDLPKEEKILMFDNMLSDLNNKDNQYAFMRAENAKGFLFFSIFERLENKVLKIKF